VHEAARTVRRPEEVVETMRKITAVALAILMGTTMFLSACGDDKEGNAKELKKLCPANVSEDTCGCYTSKVSDKYSTDELNKMIDDASLADQTKQVLLDCIDENGDGTGGDGTDTGS
jgi:hypothetical protein